MPKINADGCTHSCRGRRTRAGAGADAVEFARHQPAYVGRPSGGVHPAFPAGALRPPRPRQIRTCPKGPYSMERLGRDVLAILDAPRDRKDELVRAVDRRHGRQWLGANAPDAHRQTHPLQHRPAITPTRRCGTIASRSCAKKAWPQSSTPTWSAGSPKRSANARRRRCRAHPRHVPGDRAPKAISAAAQAIRDMDHRPLLAKIKAPTLVIAGRHDPATPLEAGEFIAQHTPNARACRARNGAHRQHGAAATSMPKRCWSFCWANSAVFRALRKTLNSDIQPRRSRNSCGVVPVCLRKNRAKCEGSENASSCSDILDRLGGEYQLAFGFGEHPLTDQMTGGDASGAFDVIVEPIDRHAEFFGVEAELVLAAEISRRPGPSTAPRWRRPAAT